MLMEVNMVDLTKPVFWLADDILGPDPFDGEGGDPVVVKDHHWMTSRI